MEQQELAELWGLELARLVLHQCLSPGRAGAIYKQGRGSSIEEVTRFAALIQDDDKDLAAFFGRELAKMVVDECLVLERPGIAVFHRIVSV